MLLEEESLRYAKERQERYRKVCYNYAILCVKEGKKECVCVYQVCLRYLWKTTEETSNIDWPLGMGTG